MKKYLLLLTIMMLCTHVAGQVNYTINEAWHFYQGSTLKPENNKHTIDIPHTWNKLDATDDTPGYYQGTGWYWRNIFIGKEGENKRIYINFEGANQILELYINNKFVGKHIGGYTYCSFDITPYVKIDQKNLFTIKVDNSNNIDIPPLSADFTFFGGIYGNVSLLFKSPIHISKKDYASSGIYIYTPKVSEKVAEITSRIIVSNITHTPREVTIAQRIISPQGIVITSHSYSTVLSLAEEQTVDSKTFEIQNPELWSPDSPALYTLETTLMDPQSKDTLDRVNEEFGLRWFSFDANKGFYLNGKHIKLIGTGRHQCRIGQGNALSDEQQIEDVLLLKKMGANFLRISHYPQNPYILRMCDKLGIISMIEIPIINSITENKAFESNSINMAKEMVKQNFNHPSLIAWAYMNEILLQPQYKSGTKAYRNYCESIKHLASHIESIIRELDPYRYTIMSCHGSIKTYQEAGLLEIPRLIGWNLYQGWYDGRFQDFDAFINAFHKQYPTIPFLITEYGADADIRLHSFKPERFDYTNEYANLYHEYYLQSIINHPFVSGAVIWNLCDFYSETRGGAVPHINCKGIIGFNREKKDTYLLYQANLLKTPYIAIGSSYWKKRSGMEDGNGICSQSVNIYSNLPQVEVIHNEASLGMYPVTHGIATVNIPFTSGDNSIRVIAHYTGGQVEDTYKCNFDLVPLLLKQKSFTELNVMLGSNRYFEDKSSNICWIPEQAYSPGSWGYIGGEALRIKTSYGSLPASQDNILNTNQDPIFQTQRIGIKSFKADVPNGEYAIYLYWADLLSENNRNKVIYNLGNDPLKQDMEQSNFSISINGHQILNNFNFAKQIGTKIAIIKKTYITVDQGQGLNIQFASRGKACLNAIRIVKLN